MIRSIPLVLLPLVLTAAEPAPPAIPTGPCTELSLALGRPTEHGIALDLLSVVTRDTYVEYGPAAQPTVQRTPLLKAPGGTPTVIEITGLTPDTDYRYRLWSRPAETGGFTAGPTYAFHTARPPGRAFTFTVQGDSHPERPGKMFSPALYLRTLGNVAQDRPDFHVLLGDDFSIERLLQAGTLSQPAVDRVYALQRGFLGVVSCSSPLFLINGNHEQAARIWLDRGPDNAAVLAGRARNSHFALPATDGFYRGDSEEVPGVGQLRDYYAWEWGDALFVTLDPYWHSPVTVDHDRAKGRTTDDRPAAKRDLWQVTLGDAQYHWLHDTLLTSRARWKFVFAHHVMGTGRGGVEAAPFYEWGGRDRTGDDRFAAKRPGWELPIQALFKKAGVTVFFQGHDHLFAHQTLDGVVYQTVPNPADDGYQAFNRSAYTSGDLLPNAGHLRVRVTSDRVTVDYVRAWLPADETAEHRNGTTAFSYTVPTPDP